IQLNRHFDVVLSERSRIARELHDTLIQGFSGVTVALQALASRVPDPDIRRRFDEIVGDASQSLRDARLSLEALRSKSERPTGLVTALTRAAHQLAQSRQIAIQLRLSDGDLRLSNDVEYNLLRIAQEAILNAANHAEAHSIQVALSHTPRSVTLSV